MTSFLWFTPVIFIVAAVYSAIGQGGGTGYLAVMAVGGLPPEMIRPTALALNILVSSLAGWKFARAGRFSRAVFIPSILSGAPAAMFGASIDLPPKLYQTMVAMVLIYAAQRLYQSAIPSHLNHSSTHTTLNTLKVAFAGALIGLISGLTGIGGGIFLSPVMILSGWADARTAAGTSALYTLVNSIVGMAVVAGRTQSLPPGLPVWLAAAGLGAWLGSEFGLKGLSEIAARRLLALALLLAALRSLWNVLAA